MRMLAAHQGTPCGTRCIYGTIQAKSATSTLTSRTVSRKRTRSSASARRNVEPWPEFEAAKRDLLPVPTWPGHEAAIECYWRCWEIAFQNFRPADEENAFVTDYSSTMYDGCLYMWDTVFIALFGRYGDRAWKFQNTLDNFYCKQHPDGGICRQFRESNGSELLQPFRSRGQRPERARLRANGSIFRPLAIASGSRKCFRCWSPTANGTAATAPGRTAATGARAWPAAWTTSRAHPTGEIIDHAHLTWVDTNMQAVLSNRIVLDIAAVLDRREEVQDFADENAVARALDQRVPVGRVVRLLSRPAPRSDAPHQGEDHRCLLGAARRRGAGRAPAALRRAPRQRRENSSVRTASRACPPTRRATIRTAACGSAACGRRPTTWCVRGLAARGYGDLAYEIAKNHHFQHGRLVRGDGLGLGAPRAGRSRAGARPQGLRGLDRHHADRGAVRVHLRSASRVRRATGSTWHIRGVDGFSVERYPFGSEGLLHLKLEPRAQRARPPERRNHRATWTSTSS